MVSQLWEGKSESRVFSMNNRLAEMWKTENLISYVLNDLEKPVKKDKATKLSVFFTGSSAYLPEP